MDASCPTASAAGADAPHAELPEMSGSYEMYISSGLYDRRYPHPNRRTLRKALGFLPEGGRFLDFGAGTGRYTLPLLRAAGASGVAYDICPAACRALAAGLDGFVGAGRLAIRNGDLEGLAADNARAFDLALLSFGVLAHIAWRSERLRTMRTVRAMLKPDGAMVLGLPNARRRFRAEQRAAAPLIRAGDLEAGDILYTRGQGGEEIPMFYHLYTPQEARADLAEAGFRVESMEPESLIAEEAAVASPLLGRLDDLACAAVPAACGYGFLISSRPDGERVS